MRGEEDVGDHGGREKRGSRRVWAEKERREEWTREEERERKRRWEGWQSEGEER